MAQITTTVPTVYADGNNLYFKSTMGIYKLDNPLITETMMQHTCDVEATPMVGGGTQLHTGMETIEFDFSVVANNMEVLDGELPQFENLDSMTVSELFDKINEKVEQRND